MNTDLFDQPLAVTLKNGRKGKPKTNPLIPVFGPGPDGKRCVDCQFQFFRSLASKYSKCEKRECSGSAKTDHNSRYAACGLFQPKPTGMITVHLRCKICGELSKGYEEQQTDHDDRMRSWGWENLAPGVWARPVEYCRNADCERQNYKAKFRKRR